MPHSRTKHLKRLDPRNPLVFDTRDLAPGTARTLKRTCQAPADMGVEMARVPAGADFEVNVQLEGVAEGVLVTASASMPLAGECARCLEPFTSSMTVRFQELFTLALDEESEPGQQDGEESYLLDEGDSILWDGTVPHRMENVGDGPAQLLIALAPAAFLGHAGEGRAQGSTTSTDSTSKDGMET